AAPRRSARAPSASRSVSEPGPEHPLGLGASLDALAAPASAPAGGSAAALVGAIAAAVTVKVARASGAEGLAAQAAALCSRLADLAPEDATALAEVREALQGATGAGGDERRDFRLGRMLAHASAVPLAIAEACADVACLAGELARCGEPDLRPDAGAAALLATGAASAAAHLVEINLGVAAGDETSSRARVAVETATSAAARPSG
ncbi:MAG: cyclodeaminase/cyclohydrolase family protein, partial [Gaiellaceae bacterium]